MQRRAVNSSNIESISYDSEWQVLYITFRSGVSYRYVGVSQAAYNAFLEAPSLGKHFHKHIKNAYDCERSTPVRLKTKKGS